MKSKLKTHTNIKRGGLVACALIGLLMWANCWGATYYCDLTLSENGAGTSGDPWQWSQAIDSGNVSGADVVNCRGDAGADLDLDSGDAKGSADNWITYQAWSGQTTPACTGINFTTEYDAYIIFDGFSVSQNPAEDQPSLVAIIDASYIHLNNCTITGDWDDVTYSGDEPSTALYDHVAGFGVYIEDSGSVTVGNIEVNGCTISNTLLGIQITSDAGDGIIFDNNHIYHFARSPVKINCDNPQTSGLITISNSHFHNQEQIWQGGDLTHGSLSIRNSNVLIDSCRVHNCGSSAGIDIYQTGSNYGYSDITIQNCLVYDTINNYAIVAEEFGTNVNYINCTVIGHTGGGGDGRTRYGTPWRVLPYDETSSLGIYNCTVVGSILFDDNSDNDSSWAVTSEDYNYIYSAWTTTGEGWLEDVEMGEHTTLLTSSATVEDLAFETTVFQQYNYNNDHGLTLDSPYFRPKSGSPLIDAGTATYAPADDIEGSSRPTGAADDIGCYEGTGVKYLLFFIGS